MSTKTLIFASEEKNRRKGLVGSILIHLVLVLLFLLPFIRFPIPPPGQEGILVNLGMPETGEGPSNPEPQNTQAAEPKPASSTPPPAAATPVAHKTEEKKVVTSEDPDALLLKRKQEEEARKKREELEAQRRAEAEARRKAEEEARLKAEEEARQQADYEQKKSRYGSLLSGSGKGNTGTPGSQGSPTGDPNASKLEGISKGSGMVGGGLGNRGVVSTPVIEDKSQKAGKVVVNVCVDKSGKVISAEYTQKGSTTTDTDLRRLAVDSAWKFLFTESSVEKQCGTITVDFKVQ